MRILYFFQLQTLLALSVLAFAWLNAGRVEVDVQIESSITSRTQVYWDTGNAFNNEQHYSNWIGVGRNNFGNLKYNDIVRPQRMRLDPLIHPGEFEIVNFEIRYADCIFPLRRFCNARFTAEQAVETQHIAPGIQNGGKILATGADPYLTWDVPHRLLSRKHALLVNLGIVFCLFSVIWFAVLPKIANPGFDGRLKSRSVIFYLGSAMLLYPVLHGVLWLGSFYINSTGYHLPIFAVNLMVFLFCLFAILWDKINYRMVPRITALMVIVAMLLPDILFHLGVIARWPTGSREIPEYHWQMGRTFEDNFQHSALKYNQEIDRISKLMPSNSVFLSDSATSYYLTSGVDAFARNPMYHHRISQGDENYFINDADLNYVCAPASDPDKVREIMEKNGISFVVLNRDKNNRNVRGSCLTELSDSVMKNINPFSSKIFEGEYLTLIDVRR